MSPKFWIMGGLIVGSWVGGYVPQLWGNDLVSFSSIIGNFIGGAIGIWAGYKMSKILGG